MPPVATFVCTVYLRKAFIHCRMGFMGRFVGAIIVMVGAAPSASMQNLVGAGSSWIRFRRSTNSLFQMRSLILGDTNESTGLANSEVSL